MTDSRQGSEIEIEVMLEKVFRIIDEGVILHEYLTDQEYATLAVTLKNVHTPPRGLRISQCLQEPLTTYALTQLLQENATLGWFHLEANRIDETGIRAIAEILKQNTKLHQLHCGFLTDGLTLDDVKALSDMLLVNTTLKDLSLYANGIDTEKTKIIAETLAKNPTLEKLSLASNEIGTEGAKALADALTKNTNLQELDLSNCRLGNDGIRAIFSALKQNTGLKTFTLRCLNPNVMQDLSDMLTENKTLHKLDIPLYTSEFTVEQIQSLLAALQKNKSLQELNIQDDDGKLKNELNEIKKLLMENVKPLAPKEEAAAGESKTDEAAAVEKPAAKSTA